MRLFILTISLGVVLGGCSSEMADLGTSSSHSEAMPGESHAAVGTSSAEDSWAAGTGDDSAMSPGYDGDMSEGMASSAEGGGGVSDGGTSTSGGDDEGPGITVEAGQLTAGMWRDLDHWDFWRNLFTEQEFCDEIDQEDGIEASDDCWTSDGWAHLEDYWGFFTADRYGVLITVGGEAAPDVKVQLLSGEETVIWEARTDNYGRAELFNGLFDTQGDDQDLSIVAFGNNPTTVTDFTPTTLDGRIAIAMDHALIEAPILDVMFAVDTTGSMGDELEYLKAELASVLELVETHQAEQNDALTVRASVNFYRDNSDEYLVRSYPFTEDLDLVNSQIGGQSANGGGDYPEAVEEGLHDAIHNHQWSGSARARLLFLVLDAPPHHFDQVMDSLQDSVEDAARQGIRIIPLVASGIDKETEFLMRFMEVATGGSYVFLTNHSGIGGNHIAPTIGDYQVDRLDMILFELITDALVAP